MRPYFQPRERIIGPDLTWKRSSDRATRCPQCGTHCRADKDNHHERTTCAHYVGVMSAAEVQVLPPEPAYDLIAQATIGQPDSRDRWHLFRVRRRL